MKRLLPVSLIVVASFIAASTQAQVYVDAHLNLPAPPFARVHFHRPPVVVETYQPGYVAPVQPYYGYNGAEVEVPAPVYYPRGYEHRYYERYYENHYRDHDRFRDRDDYYRHRDFDRDDRGRRHL